MPRTIDHHIPSKSSNLHKYRRVVLETPDGVFLTDERGLIIDWNRGMEKISALPRRSALKKELWVVWDKIAQPIPNKPSFPSDLEHVARQALKKGIPRRDQPEAFYTFRTPEGGQRVGHISLFSMREQGGGYAIGGILRDITKQFHTEEATQERERNLLLRNEITQAALEFTEMETMLQALAEKVRDSIRADSCLILLYDIYQHGFRLAATSGRSNLEVNSGSVQVFFLVAGQTLARGAPIVVEDLWNSAYFPYQHVNPLTPRSLLCLPLKSGIRDLGVILVMFEKPDQITEYQLSDFTQLANLVALAVAKIQFIEDIRQHAVEFQTLASVSAALRKITVLSDLMGVLLERLSELLQSDSTCIMLADEGTLTVSSIQGLCQMMVGDEVPSNTFPFNLALQSSEPIFLSDLSAQSKTGIERRGKTIGTLSSIALAPLRVAQSLIGILQVGYIKPHDFSDEEQRMLPLIVEMASMAIYRMQLTETLEKRVSDRTRELASLYQLTLIARDAQEISATLQHCLKEVVKAMRCQLGMVQLIGENENILILAASQGFKQEDLVHLTQTNAKSGAWGQVILSDHAQVVEIDQAEAYLPFEKAEPGQILYAGALMHAAGRKIGVLGVINTVGGKFNSSDMALLEAMADHIAAAIETINLNRRMEQMAVDEERARLSRELHDSITQALYSMTLFAESSRLMAEKGNLELTRNYLGDIYNLARQSLKEMRLIIYELRPPLLAKEKLVGALRQRLEAIEQRSGIYSRLLVEDLVDLPGDVEETLYRVAQEALNNSLKHAQANNVQVFLRRKGQLVELEIRDDGVGINLEQSGNRGGMGLSIMRERLEKMGGNLQILSFPEKGTRVIADVPLEVSVISEKQL